MILAEFRLQPNGPPVALHPRLTVVRAKGDRVDGVVATLADAIKQAAGGLDGSESVVSTAGPAPVAPAPAVDPRAEELAAAVKAAEESVATSEADLATATKALKDSEATRDAARNALDDAAVAAVSAAERAVEGAHAAVTSKTRDLEEAKSRAKEAEATRRAAEALSAIEADREAAIEKGEALRVQIDAIGPFFETEPVQEALDEFRRMEAEPRVPEARGRLLIQSWLDIQHALSELPAPPQPPEWLVAPAMAALQEARAALAAARQVAAPADATKVAALESAHREVLDAEQKVMRKGSRTNRRRLEHAQEAEKVALDELGVTAYGDYLQRIAPGRDKGGRSEGERLRQAEAALTDAEAVWEELHGYQASPEWTAARSREAEIRVEIHEILAESPADEELVPMLEARLGAIIETELARDSLETSLRLARVHMVETDDVVILAEEFLAAEPERQTRLDDARIALAAIEQELASVEERRRAVQENAFFGNAGAATPADIERLERDVTDAVAAESAAQAALGLARDRMKAHEEGESKLRELDAAVVAARTAHTKAEEAARAARAARDTLVAEQTSASAADQDRAPAALDTTPMSPMETRLYLLARFTSLKAGAGTDPRPVVVEARAPIGPSVLDLLNRTAGPLQLVVVTDDAGAASWAAGLGEGARLVDA